MPGRLKFLLSYYFLWLVFFELARLLFVVYNYSAATESKADLPLAFVYGLRMDLAAAAYIVLPVCLFCLLSYLFVFFRRSTPYLIYNYVIGILILLLTVCDLEVYQNWGFRIDATPLKYLASPSEAWASVSHLPIAAILVCFIAAATAFLLTLRRWTRRHIYLLELPSKPWLVIIIFVFTAFLIVPMRGGLQQTPMNQSMVYFSKQNFSNVAAVNATWNFLNGLAKGAPTKNPYLYLSNNRVEAIVDSLYSDSGKTVSYLNTERPNVILVVWESFTAKALTTSVNGIPVTPRFNELKHEGIYFSDLYASGDRTDKGLAAVLSGYPAMNNVSIIRYPNKSAKLNTLSGFFNHKKYETRFYYGGETEFANIKSFLLQGSFGHITDKKDFKASEQNSKWGAHDGVVAARILKECTTIAQPFFLTWLTLSSHEPFETPNGKTIAGNDNTSLFANSLHYTDQVLFDFVRNCEQQPWWKSTLLIVIADHGHPLFEPSNRIDNFRIPMLWLGGALKNKGMVVDKTGSQIDLASTLERQLDPASRLFPFSKNIFDSASRPWAYYSFNDGFGWAAPGQNFVFDNTGKSVILQRGRLPGDVEVNAAKAMQQKSFGDYISK